MDLLKSVTFWITFSAVLLASLLIGGLVSATLQKCPAFGWLLLISLASAFIGGLLGSWLLSKRIVAAASNQLAAAADRFVPDAAAKLPNIGELQAKLASIKSRLPSADAF